MAMRSVVAFVLGAGLLSISTVPAFAQTQTASVPSTTGMQSRSAPSSASATPAVPASEAVSPVVATPPSELYGALYRDVELAHIYADSKTFADMIPTSDPQQIVALYQQQRGQPGFDLKQFVAQHFILPSRSAKQFVSVPNQNVTQHIDTLWNVLRRDPDASPSQWSSLLPLPHPYIVPGDRFDEIYYWDSYFIMLGLQQSGRDDLLNDELNNFATLIDRYGHIPNGNRSYYLSRSQPPFFAQMVRLAAEKGGDQVYLKYQPELEKEYAYWMDGSATLKAGQGYRHLVKLPDGTLMNRYWDDRAAPRDESYREDVITAQQMPQREAGDLWRNLRAAGETGWDFSSRWFDDGKTLATVDVTSLVPVDLNSLMVDLERTLAKSYRLQGNAAMAATMEKRAATRSEAIRRVLWDPQMHAFGDYNFVDRALTHRLSAATVYPLFSGIATKAQAKMVATTVRDKLLRPGGLATTEAHSGQQWDEPNGWAPLQYLAVVGLRRYGDDDLARTIATRWIRNDVQYYQHTGKLVEKYDVDGAEKAAGGGEYPLQDGFGWTNGVLRALMVMYPAAPASSTRPVDVPGGAEGVSAAAASAAAAPKTSHSLDAPASSPTTAPAQ